MTCKHLCNSSLYRTQIVFCVRYELRPKKLLTTEPNNYKSVAKIQQICEEYYVLQTSPILLEMLM